MKASLISNFNLQNFAGYLRNTTECRSADLALSPIGQVAQILRNEHDEVWNPRPEVCVVWTQPEAVLASFAALLRSEEINMRAVESEVLQFSQLLIDVSRRTQILFVPTWSLHPFHIGHGLADLSKSSGALLSLMRANVKLIETINNCSNIYPLSSEKWIQITGMGAFNSRLWYGAKVPFGNEVFKHAARDINSAIRGIRGRAKKLVVVDLDDTLWGGIVGDIGWQRLILGGHDPVGEALVDFQRTLKALNHQGIALGILSKNEETTALEAIRLHPEMELRPENFAGWRINWGDKAQNLVELVRELNLGLESVVFIDDNPVERARIREAFPQVLVPDWPEDKRLYNQTLLSLDCFDKPVTSGEDRQRSRMYAEERMRVEIRDPSASLDDWLKTLDLVVTVSPLSRENLSRITQLLNKTNQMNLSTRRLTETDLLEWASTESRKIWGFRVKDRFGDSGLAGILSLEILTDRAVIVDFILSCRVMGRRVEEAMIQVACNWICSCGLTRLEAAYRPTPKNLPCLEFLKKSGSEEEGTGIFVWNTAKQHPDTSAVRIVYDGTEIEAYGERVPVKPKRRILHE